MNSGNLVIFFSSESILILKIPACRALKIIAIDIKVGTIPWDFKVENPYYNFCVGRNMSGQLATIFVLQSKDVYSRNTT